MNDTFDIFQHAECMTERITLWTKVFMPLCRLCADRGYILDIQDDLWLSRNLERAYTHLLTLQEITDDQATHAGSEANVDAEMPVDVVLVSGSLINSTGSLNISHFVLKFCHLNSVFISLFSFSAVTYILKR